MSKRTYRVLQSLLLLITLFVLFASFYFQYGKGLQPCPLCLMQRFCTFFLAMFFLMGLCLSTLKRGQLVAIFQLFFAIAGLFFSLRQLWLQMLPTQHTEVCLPGFDILVRYFPWQEVFRALFWGASDCAEITWKWLGLSMPAWSALYFLGMFFASMIIFIRLRQSLNRLEQ